MTTLIIARHGNTFDPGDTVTYVGGRTDLPLVEKGREQARAIGVYLKENSYIPDVVYSAPLKRTLETARTAIKESGVTNPVYELDIFKEIDYGPDENKTREDVIARIGEKAHKDWENHNIVPEGWGVEAQELIQNWQNFAAQIRAHDDNETVIVFTSNGIARFAPYITGDYESFRRAYSPKLATGSLGIMSFANGAWAVQDWNIRP